MNHTANTYYHECDFIFVVYVNTLKYNFVIEYCSSYLIFIPNVLCVYKNICKLHQTLN